MPSYPADVNDTVVYNGADLYLPKDCSMTVFEDSRLFLFGEIYLNGQPVLAGPSTPSGVEVYVGPTQPVDPGVLLWWDINAQPPYGALKVRVGGSFKLTDDAQKFIDADEIFVGAAQPVALNYELWVDTSAAPVLKAKIAGNWTLIFGAKGDPGTPGSTGATGPQGPPGIPGDKWVQLTQAQYNALSPPNAATLYIIIG